MVNSFLTMLHFLVVALAGHAKSAPQPCPLYAQKRTLIDNFRMSVKGHKPTLVDGAATRISANHRCEIADHRGAEIGATVRIMCGGASRTTVTRKPFAKMFGGTDLK
jgi:hypothetical protein